MRRVIAAAVVAIASLGCSAGTDADDDVALTSALLTNEAVNDVFPELRPSTEHADGGDHGRLASQELAGGPLEAGERAVVRQWSVPFSRDRDDPVVPMVFNVTSTVVAMADEDAARAGVERLLDMVGDEGARPVPHDRFEAALTPPNDAGIVAAVGAAVAGDRVVTLQVDAVERIDPRSFAQILDRAADRLS